MKRLWQFLKECWMIVVTIGGGLAIIAGIIAFYSTLATSADLEKAQLVAQSQIQQQIEVSEKKTNEQIKQLRTTMTLDRNITRLNQVNDMIIKIKVLLRSYPRDKDLLEDYEALKKDKERLQQLIEKPSQ